MTPMTSDDPQAGLDPSGRYPAAATAPRRRHSFDDLSTGRCYELLSQHSVGRIAWSAADGPQMFPLSYAWLDGIIVFRTSPYGILSELVQRTPVVFEVDEIQEAHRIGWSVILRGRAAGIASPDQLSRPASISHAIPWASGHRNLVIAITPTEITGRAFRPTFHDDFS
jgi:uncharacterized protein